MLEVRLAGIPATSIGTVEALKYSHAAVGGPLAASWRMGLRRGYTHPLLRQGTLVEIYLAGMRIWVGLLSEPNRVTWEFTADGLFRQAEDFLALDSSGNPTTIPNAAVYQATQRSSFSQPMRGWIYPSTGGVFPTTSSSTILEGTFEPVYLANLLGDLCQKNGRLWGIDPHTRTPYYRAKPTTPTVAIAPGVPAIPTSPSGQTTFIVGRRATATGGTPAQPTAWAVSRSTSATALAAAKRWNPREKWSDLTDRGALTDSAAVTILNLMVDAGISTPPYSEGVELVPGQVTNLGGVALDPRLIVAGQLNGEMTVVNQLGVLDTEGTLAPGQAVAWLIGTSSYDTTTGVLELVPYLAETDSLPEVIQIATADGPKWALQTPVA
ncbi:hypothetical protein [Nocardioides fonticola]